jgi:hypothetical protein
MYFGTILESRYQVITIKILKMSQHSFQHNNLEVLYGYEWVFNGFFLVITGEDDLDIVFSNLNLANPAMTIPQIKNALKKYNIPIPENLDKILLNDKKLSNE